MARLSVLVIAVSLIANSTAKQGDAIARSDFNWGADDWEVFGPGKLSIYEVGSPPYHAGRLQSVVIFF
jgi:hypothetical protein